MCYSDFPIPVDWPHYIHHSDVLEYLINYNEKFKLKEHIQFNTTVTNVIPNVDGTWDVTVQKRDKSTETFTFDAVMVL